MSQAGEKTEQPTAKRLRDARRKGQVARSHDLSSAVLLVVSVAVLYLAGGHIAGWAGGAMREQLEYAATYQGPLDQAAALGALFTGIKAMAFVLAPLFGALLVVALLANYFQVGSVFTFEPVKPNANKLNPAEGFKKKFLKARPYVELGEDGAQARHRVSRRRRGAVERAPRHRRADAPALADRGLVRRLAHLHHRAPRRRRLPRHRRGRLLPPALSSTAAS